MDHKIYGRLQRTDFGVYGTRRYPKGQAITPDVKPSGPISPIDPAANPTPISGRFLAAISGIHTETKRWQYIVPVNRRAIIQEAYVQMSRVAVPGVNAMDNARIGILRKSNPVSEANIVSVTSFDSTQIREHHRAYTETPVELFEGDILSAYTTNLGGGSMSYELNAVMIEYNSDYKVREGYADTSTFNPRS